LKLATSGGVSIYRQLESSLSEVVGSAQHHADDLVKEAKIKSTEIIHFVWWFLGGFILSSIVLGWVVILKVGKILELSRQTAKQLLESEERMQLALSGADEGTWDLDISTGKLSFDSKWGGILGYSSDSVRPSNLEDWAALIHGEDRDRVLKAMGDHIGCSSFEYKEEYRIRSKSGALKWVSGHGRAVSRDSAGKALRIVGVTRDITMKKQAEEKIWQLAHSDYLTGLPNRAMFYDRLQQCMSHAKRHKKKLAIFFMDLDDFKQVNDNFGHDVGDLLLQEVAVRLRRIIRAEDTVARTGGDEFLFILNDVARIEDAGTLAEKIIQSVADPFLIQGNSCMIGSSIGISFFPDDSDDMDTLVTQSDEAMYKAKERGKNNYQFYSPNSR
jgi:diguanylate cyclase (GGDEF)-like protein/PAS domain S-box-containing protein